MARAPLLQLSDIALTFGGDPVFHDLSAVIQQGDRIALVGRNGSGKSTLMRLMAGLIEPDRAGGYDTSAPRSWSARSQSVRTRSTRPAKAEIDRAPTRSGAPSTRSLTEPLAR